MSENLQNVQSAPTPNPDLKSLERLVGRWKVSGEAEGEIRYEWMERGFFLVQHFDLMHGDRRNKGMEVIGHDQDFGVEPSKDIRARIYDAEGNTFTYVYELKGDTLIIWGGAKGSSSYFKGTFSPDGNTLTGGWQWPGGGYTTTTVRIK